MTSDTTLRIYKRKTRLNSNKQEKGNNKDQKGNQLNRKVKTTQKITEIKC